MFNEDTNELTLYQEIDGIERSQEKLSQDTENLAIKIVEQEDPKEVKDLLQLFNLNHTKKQVLRSMAADQLLDSIMCQAKERITKRGDQFSNKDLLDYMNAMSNMVEKSNKKVGEVDAVPIIQLNQQNNITVAADDNLDRESAQRVLEFVKNAMQAAKEASLNEEIFEYSETDNDSTVLSIDNINVDSSQEEGDEKFTSFSLDNLFNLNEED